MRAATREGLAVLVSDAKRRSDLELAAAVSHQQKVLKALGKDETAASGGIPKEYRERSRDVLLQRAAEGVSDATGQSVLVRTETASLGAAVRGQHVEVSRAPHDVSTGEDRAGSKRYDLSARARRSTAVQTSLAGRFVGEREAQWRQRSGQSGRRVDVSPAREPQLETPVSRCPRDPWSGRYRRPSS